MMHSRHLGAIVFCEDGDESIVDASILIAGVATPARLVVASPRLFAADELDALDARLDGIDALDDQARRAMTAGVADEESPVAQLAAFYLDDVDGWQERTASEFAAALSPVLVSVYPDGAWAATSVIGIDYSVDNVATDQLIAVRFPDGSTPVLSWES